MAGRPLETRHQRKDLMLENKVPGHHPRLTQHFSQVATRLPHASRHQSAIQHLTDRFWHYPGAQGMVITMGCVLALLIAVQAALYIRHRAGRTGDMVPAAPGDHEHFSYFKHQWRRSLTVVYAILSAGGLYGLYAVFTKSWVWYPFLVTLAVMVPWTLYMIIVTLRRPAINIDTHKMMVADLHRPSVDVFIPTCGESPAVVRNTYEHVRALNWRGELRVYALDDSPDDRLRGLAAEYGFTYLRRRDRPRGKKSGALNNALRYSSGEYIVVFDADFAPAPAFLEQTVPYFGDPDVGIVQTSQYFGITRRDTVNWIDRLSGVVQGMFFCWSQPGQQTKNAAICVGTNVLYRRAALNRVGGFPWCEAGGEDVVTSVALLGEGWRTVYVPLNLAKGLCPDTFAGAINQQYRWCLTTLGLIFPVRGMDGADRGFWACKMTITQRISYLSGILYYLQSMLTLVISVMPALIMLWVYPYQVGPGNYLPITPMMLSMLTLPLMIPGWRPEMLRLSMVYGVAHLLACVDAATGRIQGWVPTGSTSKPKKNRTPARAAVILRGWVAVTQGLMAWALVRDVPVYGLPAYWIPAALAIMQAMVLLPLLLPGYGTIGINVRRMINADFFRHFHSPRRGAAGPEVLVMLRQPDGRGQPGTRVLHAGSGGVQPRRAGDHRKPRQRQLSGVERSQSVPVRQSVDQGQVRVPVRAPGRDRIHSGGPPWGVAGDLAARR